MKSNGIIHYPSKEAYQSRTKILTKKSPKLVDSKVANSLKDDISKKSKEIVEQKGKELKDKIKIDKNKLKSAAKHLLFDGAKTLKAALDTVKTPSIPLRVVEDILPTKKISGQKVTTKSDDSSIFFITGLDLSIFDNEDSGLKNLSNFTKGSRHDSWRNEEEILNAIKSLDGKKPVMLIGHSLGGDSAVNIANRLNTAEYGFKKVDLLVTLDSVGFDNDLIPENVKVNKNYISDQDYFFNDGPNIARNHNKSQVENILKNKLHTELDSDPEIQAEIIHTIKDRLAHVETLL